MPVGMGREQWAAQEAGGRGALHSWGTALDMHPGTMALGTLLSSPAVSFVCGVAPGGGGEGAGSGTVVLAHSQRTADSGLLNFSRWRIKQVVADCPQAE